MHGLSIGSRVYILCLPMIMKLGMEHHLLKLYKVYKNGDPELACTHFKTMSNLAKLVFCNYSRPRYQVSRAITGPLVIWLKYMVSANSWFISCLKSFSRYHNLDVPDIALMSVKLNAKQKISKYIVHSLYILAIENFIINLNP